MFSVPITTKNIGKEERKNAEKSFFHLLQSKPFKHCQGKEGLLHEYQYAQFNKVFKNLNIKSMTDSSPLNSKESLGKYNYSSDSGERRSRSRSVSKEKEVIEKCNSNSGGIPDVKMINRYYGLIPKKFTVHSRQEYGKAGFRQRSKSAITTIGNRKTLASETSEINHSLQNLEIRPTNPKPESEGVQAKRVPIERQQRLLKYRGRSASLPAQLSPKRENKTKNCSESFSRVIKIDLNNLRWEECSSPNPCDDYGSTSLEKVYNSSDDEEENGDSESNNNARGNAHPSQINTAHKGVIGLSSVMSETSTSVDIGECYNEGVNPSVSSEHLSETKHNTTMVKRKGILKKTISFDESILRNEDRKDDQESALTFPPRPQSARPKTAKDGKTASNVSNQWKSMSATDRRSRFQKSRSANSGSSLMSMSTASTVSSLEVVEEDDEELSNFVGAFPPPNSSAYREIRKSLFFHQAPEVCTLISQITPIETLETEVEVEKVAALLSSLNNNNFIDLTSPKEREKDQTIGLKRIESRPNANALPLPLPSPLKPFSNANANANTISQDLNGNPIPVTENQISPEENPVKLSEGNGDIPSGEEKPQESMRRPPLRKSFSLACERELSPSPGENAATKGNGGNGVRPKSSFPFPLARGKSSATLLPSRSCQPQSQAKQNRQALIKKALIYGEKQRMKLKEQKKINEKRPKTAPQNKVKANVVKDTNNMMRDNGKMNKRIPLKPSAATLVMAGGKGSKGQLFIPHPAMGKQGGEIAEEKSGEDKQTLANGIPQPLDVSARRKSFTRQSFSLDEGLLLAFSNDKVAGEEMVRSSKKREECLKIYEKMLRTGMSVKLDTIFRGMMTPSEYRIFTKAAEKAAKDIADAEAAAAETEQETVETNAGIGNNVKPLETTIKE